MECNDPAGPGPGYQQHDCQSHAAEAICASIEMSEGAKKSHEKHAYAKYENTRLKMSGHECGDGGTHGRARKPLAGNGECGTERRLGDDKSCDRRPISFRQTKHSRHDHGSNC